MKEELFTPARREFSLLRSLEMEEKQMQFYPPFLVSPSRVVAEMEGGWKSNERKKLETDSREKERDKKEVQSIHVTRDDRRKKDIQRQVTEKRQRKLKKLERSIEQPEIYPEVSAKLVSWVFDRQMQKEVDNETGANSSRIEKKNVEEFCCQEILCRSTCIYVSKTLHQYSEILTDQPGMLQLSVSCEPLFVSLPFIFYVKVIPKWHLINSADTTTTVKFCFFHDTMMDIISLFPGLYSLVFIP